MAIYQIPVLSEFSWQLPVLDKDLSTPPGSPAKGDRYIVGVSATGVWATHETDIAYYDGSAWVFDTPSAGWKLYVTDESNYYKFGGVTWASEVTIYGNELIIEAVRGGTSADQDLILESTSHATKGTVFIQPNGGSVVVGNTTNDVAPLTVKTITSEGLRVLYSDTQYLKIHENDGSNHYLEAVGDVPLKIKNNSANYGIQLLVNGGGVYLDKDGKLGLNRSTPGATLDCNGDAIFNESGLDKDFRVESLNQTHMVFVDASADKLGICTNVPEQTVTLVGTAYDQFSISSDTTRKTYFGHNASSALFDSWWGVNRRLSDGVFDDTGLCAAEININTSDGDSYINFSTSVTNNSAPTSRVKIKGDGGVFMYAVKSGATQSAAGAAAGELWRTSGHATMPDNFLAIGV